MKTRTALLAVSHVALAAAGFALHRADTPASSAATPPPVEKSPASRLSSATPEAPTTNIPGDSPWSATDCRTAWHALKGSQLPPDEIAILRLRIMDEWLKKDLHSALIAWTDEETLGPNLRYHLDGAIAGHEKELLEWILAGDFGLDSKILLDQWAQFASKDPDILLATLPRLPEERQEELIPKLFPTGLNREQLDARIARIAEIPDEALRVKAWIRMLQGVRDDARLNGREDRVAELLVREDVPPEARRAAAESYAIRLADEREPPKALEAFRKLSPEDQRTVGPKLLEQAGSYSSFHASAVTNALTMLVESNQWEVIESQGPPALDDFFKTCSPNAEAVSRWAMQLPARDEAASIFRHAVAGRFRDDLNAGAEWAHSLDEGWYRDQALAQLAIAAAGNIRLCDQAIGEIQDPDIRQEMETWQASRKK